VCVCSRPDHSKNVFTSMETIMSLVIEESEEISSELLSSLLDTLKKDKKVRNTFIVLTFNKFFCDLLIYFDNVFRMFYLLQKI